METAQRAERADLFVPKMPSMIRSCSSPNVERLGVEALVHVGGHEAEAQVAEVVIDRAPARHRRATVMWRASTTSVAISSIVSGRRTPRARWRWEGHGSWSKMLRTQITVDS
jgi:creatinine amidohydrolase/Fe(II)-dependent formamide hydrolase-like protein